MHLRVNSSISGRVYVYLYRNDRLVPFFVVAIMIYCCITISATISSGVWVDRALVMPSKAKQCKSHLSWYIYYGIYIAGYFITYLAVSIVHLYNTRTLFRTAWRKRYGWWIPSNATSLAEISHLLKVHPWRQAPAEQNFVPTRPTLSVLTALPPSYGYGDSVRSVLWYVLVSDLLGGRGFSTSQTDPELIDVRHGPSDKSGWRESPRWAARANRIS